MNVYTTIDELKEFIEGGLGEGIETDSDSLMRRFCIDASRMFDTWVTNGVPPKRHFYPTSATKEFDHPTDSPTVLRLQNDLLEITTLTTENGSVTILPADYVPVTSKGDHNRTPYAVIKLPEDSSVGTFSYNGTKLKANAIDGIWGYHDEWADAWEDSGDVVKDDPQITAVATTLTVDDSDGDDINGFPHRFKAQQVIRIGDEYLWVTAVDRSNDILTVRRGMNGTTAAVHLKDVSIDIFRPMDDVRAAMTALVAYLYQHRSSIGSPDDRPLATADGVMVLPSTLPEEVQRMLKPYRKERLLVS